MRIWAEVYQANGAMLGIVNGIIVADLSPRPQMNRIPAFAKSCLPAIVK